MNVVLVKPLENHGIAKTCFVSFASLGILPLRRPCFVCVASSLQRDHSTTPRQVRRAGGDISDGLAGQERALQGYSGETGCRQRHLTGLGGVGCAEEVADAAEVLGVDKAEALDEVLAPGVEVVAAAIMGDHSLVSNLRELQ
ncbi:LRR receptor-like serine/threonine-protein kinase RKF3 [Pyrus ussuriensis x Pyrus communis]|uniref:LRR receptor-like serine/threonine-protein kinase RKF3 n=1 Tax=Pyrus ussuriensis x Pyrus communis TaxID=2448454 RepID=A0A5N5GUH7_9ROSA|nr:LRR receptor-like serine/threonine-protein kinase RKF3 [Pyrus ussuriensis x Pyrus communis]